MDAIPPDPPAIEAPDPQARRMQLLATAVKQKLPLAVLDPTCQWTTDRDAQAVEALNKTTDRKNETGGVVFKNDKGEFCYSIPVGGKESGHITFGINPQAGLTVDSLYHTHPTGGGNGDAFSPDDVQMAKQLKVASYIKNLGNNTIRRYEPGTSSESTRGTNTQRTSLGTVVPQPIKVASQ
jgi:hypothetical protein